MERITGELDVSDIKRFQMPETIIEIRCPKCGDVMEIEMTDQIYYPEDPPDDGHSIAFECEKCGIEVARRIDIVSVIVTLDVHDQETV